MPYDPNTPMNPDQPQYPQPQYPQPQYPQPGYGQPPQYPQQEYGQPGAPSQGMGYGQPGAPSQGMGYGQPGYPSQAMGYGGPPPGSGYPGAYPPQAPRRSKAPLIAGIVGGVVLLCVVACVAVFFLGGGAHGFMSGFSSGYNSALTAATQTAEATQATPTPSETVLYQDTLTDTPSGWANDSYCAAKTDGYHVKGGYLCFAPDAASSPDVDVTVTVKGVKLSADTAYDIVFRHTSQGNFYVFEITPDGQWAFVKVVNDKGTPISDYQSNSAIQTSTGATNVMRVLAVGSHFVFFINGQQVGVADDTTFTSGSVALGSDDSTSNSDIVFTNLIVAQPD